MTPYQIVPMHLSAQLLGRRLLFSTLTALAVFGLLAGCGSATNDSQAPAHSFPLTDSLLGDTLRYEPYGLALRLPRAAKQMPDPQIASLNRRLSRRPDSLQALVKVRKLYQDTTTGLIIMLGEGNLGADTTTLKQALMGHYRRDEALQHQRPARFRYQGGIVDRLVATGPRRQLVQYLFAEGFPRRFFLLFYFPNPAPRRVQRLIHSCMGSLRVQEPAV